MVKRKVVEQRKNPRVIVRALVDYESSETFLYDYSTDLSEGGIFIETDKPLKKGTPLTLRFTLPGIDRVFEVKSKVAWLNQAKGKTKPPATKLPRGMGVQFQTMDDTDYSLIRTYVSKFSGSE